MPQPLVLAIEPDLRQAAIVKRIVREKVLADVTVVDSRDAALDAMRTMMPDVLLLSALMSPRDEDELIAHLRTLEHADHLQTHTIPQLASTLNPTENRMPRGLLSAFRRKKEPEVAPSGCDPDLFAEEIRVFLERAADKKRERSAATPNAAPADTAWRAAHTQKAAEPVATTDAAAETEASSASSWSSPFEWKPSAVSTPMADPESSVASSESPLPSVDSLMAHLRPPAGFPTVADLAASSQTDERVLEIPPLDVHVPDPLPIVAAAPALESQPAVEEQVAVREERHAKTDARPKADDRGSTIADSGLGIRDQRLGIRDQRLGIRDQRLGIRDRAPVRLGGLAGWARSEDRGRDAAQESDDLRALLTGLAVPPAVVSVGYGRGCRIRRVRVLAAREAHDAEAVGAVIISRRVLSEQRGLRDQQQA